MTNLKVTRRGEMLVATVNEELVGLHLDQGAYFSFNPTAQRVWALTEEPSTVAALCEQLCEEFDVDPQDCEADVLELLRKMESDGLVTLEPV
ncbi:PqqD family protein [Sphingomonas sp. MMS24-J45]|uniref:PqqD family protein n=1 Tax=Sphingomonas sp. MMS24-J45 TaxID=3238806 RepID=UPI00384DD2AE